MSAPSKTLTVKVHDVDAVHSVHLHAGEPANQSMNERWLMLGTCWHTFTPVRSPLPSAAWSKDEKPSAHIKNRYSYIGSPCLKPLIGIISSVLLTIYFEVIWYCRDTSHDNMN